MAIFLCAGCAQTPTPPEQVYICEINREIDEARYSARKYLYLDGQFKRGFSSPQFYEDSEISWHLPLADKNVQASLKSQPWDSSAYNHTGNITLRVTPPRPVPPGTRVYLELPGRGRVSEGFPFNEKSISSAIFMDWPAFRSIIDGYEKAQFVFISPEGDVPHRIGFDLQPIYEAKKAQSALIMEIDQMAEQYETDCRHEVLEYIILT
jgi:hypothetical protein